MHDSIAVIVQNLPYMMRGLTLTFYLTIVGVVGSFLLGTLLALMRTAPWALLRAIAIIYIDTLRMIPLIMVIFWVFFLLPILSGRTMSPVLAVLVALIAYNASYMAEVIRSGINSVPKGLLEAARSSGMTYAQSYTRIVLPLAFEYMLPALVTRIISVLMGTSLAYVIGVAEFFRAAYDVNSRVIRSYEIYSFVAVVYFLLCFGLSLLGRYFERRGRGNKSARMEIVDA